MKRKKTEKKLNKINKKLLKLSKKMKKLQKKKNKLVVKFKGVKKSSALKIVSKKNGNGNAEEAAKVTTVEPTQSH